MNQSNDANQSAANRILFGAIVAVTTVISCFYIAEHLNLPFSLMGAMLIVAPATSVFVFDRFYVHVVSRKSSGKDT